MIKSARELTRDDFRPSKPSFFIEWNEDAGQWQFVKPETAKEDKP